MDDIKIVFCEYCDWLTFPRDTIQRSNKCPHCLGMTGHVVVLKEHPDQPVEEFRPVY